MFILIRDLQNPSFSGKLILSVWDSTQGKFIRLTHHWPVFSFALTLNTVRLDISDAVSTWTYSVICAAVSLTLQKNCVLHVHLY